MNEDEQLPVTITGGVVESVEGLRVWARFLGEDHDVLILIKPKNNEWTI